MALLLSCFCESDADSFDFWEERACSAKILAAVGSTFRVLVAIACVAGDNDSPPSPQRALRNLVHLYGDDSFDIYFCMIIHKYLFCLTVT